MIISHDTLYNVLSFIPEEERFKNKRVCKEWNNLITNKFPYSEDKLISFVAIPALEKLFVKFFSKYRQLDLILNVSTTFTVTICFQKPAKIKECKRKTYSFHSKILLNKSDSDTFTSASNPSKTFFKNQFSIKTSVVYSNEEEFNHFKSIVQIAERILSEQPALSALESP